MELLTYLLKVSACLMLFFAFYLLVLNKLTFFRTNRFYLLGSLLVSFLIPTLHFTVEREIAQTPIVYEESTAQVNENQELTVPQHFVLAANPVETTEKIEWIALMPYAYALIALVLLLIGIKKLVVLLQYTKQNAKSINGLKLLKKTQGFTNCSFFNYVFIDEQSLTANELEVLLQHEKVHADQYHSIDKILMMLVKAVLWFNPVVYLWDKALEQAHEYEADKVASQTFGNHTYAGLLLKLAVGESQNTLIHNFVKSPVKERIKMLFNSKSKNMKKLAYLLVTPLVLGLIWGFTVEVVEVFPSLAAKPNFTIVLDAGHGGSQKGAEVNGYTEKVLTLSIAKKISVLAQSKGIKVVMTRDGDENVSIKERLAKEGDILISLHVNSEPLTNAKNSSGIEMYTAVADETLKVPKANALGQYLFKEMESLQGISVKDERQPKNLALLRESKIPGVVLELGYLTNKNDFQFITNETKQNELAEGIVDGIVSYKNATEGKVIKEVNRGQKDNLLGTTIKGKVDSISGKELWKILHFKVGNHIYRLRHDIPAKIKVGDELTVTIGGRMDKMTVNNHKKNEELIYDGPVYLIKQAISSTGELLIKAPEKHAFLYEANKVRFTTSKIESIKRNSNGVASEVILNDGIFKIYLDVAALKAKAENFKVGDQVTAKFIGEQLTAKNTYATSKLIILYSAAKKDKIVNTELYNKFYTKEGFQILREGKPKSLKITTIAEDQVKVVSASETKSYVSRGITNLKNAVLQIGKTKLEAEKVTLDSKSGTLIAEDAKVYFPNGQIKSSKMVIYNTKKKTYTYYEFAKTEDDKKANLVLDGNREGDLAFTKDVSISKINYYASDSLKQKRFERVFILYGKANIDLEKYKLNGKVISVDEAKKTITVYYGTLKDDHNLKVEAEVIEVNLANNTYKTKSYADYRHSPGL